MSNKTKDFVFKTNNDSFFKDIKSKSTKPRGRPNKNDDEKFNKQITIKFSSREYEYLTKLFKMGRNSHFNSMSSFLRYIILNKTDENK